MGSPERFNLRWNSFETNKRTVFMKLREESEFDDVTVVADCGKQVEANKVVLAAGSMFFHKILKGNPHPHPLIYLKGVGYEHLSSVLDFVYTGEAHISKDDLNEFLEIAQDLKVKGLTEEAGLSSRTSHSHSPGEAGLSSRTSHPHHPGEPGLSSRASHPHRVISSVSQGQVVEEKAAPSHSMSRPHYPKYVPCKSHVFVEEVASPPTMSRPPPTPDEEVAPSPKMPRLRSVKSAPSHGPEVSDETAPSPGVSHPHIVTSSREDHQEASPSPGMSHPHTVTSSHLNNALSQSTCEDHHDNFCNIKVEVGDAEQDNVAYWNNDHGEDGFEDNEKYIDVYQSVEGAQNDHVVNTENKPKEEVMDSCNGVVITETAIGILKKERSAPDWYEVGEKNTNTFGKLNNLMKHKKIHAGKMPNQCSGKKPYQCPVCLKIFPWPSHLKRHIGVHTGEKPYQCLHCNKSFSDARDLKKHEKIHG